jgi:hypothetical protein
MEEYIGKQDIEIIGLKEYDIQQDIIITGLKEDIVELKKDNKKFLDIVIELKARDDPLTVREGLSKWIITNI